MPLTFQSSITKNREQLLISILFFFLFLEVNIGLMTFFVLTVILLYFKSPKKRLLLTFQFVNLLCLNSFSQDQKSLGSTISPFTTLELNGSAEVEIISYDSVFFSVNGEGSYQENMLITQEGDKLIITTLGLINDEYKIKIGCKGLNRVIIQNTSLLESEVPYKTQSFSISSKGTSKTKLLLEAKTVDIKTENGGSVRLKGSAEQLTIKANDASKVKCIFFETQNVDVQTSGTAEVIVNVKQALIATADGDSRIYYAGSPALTSNKKGNSMIEDYSKEERKKFNSLFENGFKHWTGIGINFTGYTNTNYQAHFTSPNDYMNLNGAKSIGWNLNAFEYDFHLKQNYINLCTGVGIELNHYSLKNKISLKPDSSYVGAAVNPNYNYKKNNLNVSFVEVPLILDLNNSKNPEKAFHLGAGAVFGFKIRSRTKQQYEIGGYNYSVAKVDNYNLNPFKIEAMIQLGYGRFIVLYGKYSFTTLFRNNAGPVLYPFTFGLRVIPFATGKKGEE